MECCCGKLLIILFGTHSFALIFNCCLGFELPVESDDDISNSVVVKDRGSILRPFWDGEVCTTYFSRRDNIIVGMKLIILEQEAFLGFYMFHSVFLENILMYDDDVDDVFGWRLWLLLSGSEPNLIQ